MITPQQQADHLLSLWRLQAAIGIPPAQRRLPANSNEADKFERDLESIREVMEEAR
ncbi:MAG TPA: hypothetical protein VFX37_08100 [Pseudolabrys sp.]|nr:hypothetical protein [Pseudolabrys sp.]